MTTPTPTPDVLLLLAEAVVDDGFEAHRDEVAELVVAARRSGVRPVLVDVLADAASPPVARRRALGRVLVALAAADVAGADPAGAARPAVSAAA